MNDMSPGQARLLERLRSGQDWLIALNAQLLSMPDAGVGTDVEVQFCERRGTPIACL